MHAKKTAAQAAVERDIKFALPVAPNKLPEAPLPNDAPMSAPLPCCTNTKPIMVSADKICAATTKFKIQFIFSSSKKLRHAQRSELPMALQMATKSAALREAPPINPPSMSG